MIATETEVATSRAVDTVASRVRERDAAEEKTDPEIFALAVMTDLRGQGWRPTPARPALSIEQHIGPPPHPETAHRGADLVRAALRGEEIQ